MGKRYGTSLEMQPWLLVGPRSPLERGDTRMQEHHFWAGAALMLFCAAILLAGWLVLRLVH